MPKESKSDLKRGHPKVRWQSGPTLAVCLGLVVLMVLVYGQTLWFDFVNWDDEPKMIDNTHVRSDNGPQFIAKQLQCWLDQAAVRTLYIQRNIARANGCVESFNSKLRDELLNRELFLSVPEARYVLDK